jgi:hypothetical protein
MEPPILMLQDVLYDVLAAYPANWFLAIKYHKPIDINLRPDGQKRPYLQ